MKPLWLLIRESVIVQGLVTMAVTGAAVYQWIVTGTLDPTLLNVLLALYGFWFGSYSQKAAVSTAEAVAKALARKE